MAITLGVFQEIYKIQKSDIDSEEKITEMVSVLSGKPVSEVEDLQVPEFNKLSYKVMEILKTPLPEAKPQKTIAGYNICYEPAKLKRGQYVTLMHFMKGDVVENAHLIMACLVTEEGEHSEIADKMQDAPLSEIYPACLFFCELYRVSIRSLENYLVKEMLKKKMPLKKSQQIVKGLMTGLDGYTMPNGLQNLKALA